MKKLTTAEKYIAGFTVLILLRLLEVRMWNKPWFGNLLQRQTCEVLELDQREVLKEIEPCAVCERKEVNVFCGERPNPDQNLERQTCEVLELDQREVLKEIEPCAVCERKEVNVFCGERPNPDQNLDAPKFDNDESPSNLNRGERPNPDQNLDAPEFDNDETPSNLNRGERPNPDQNLDAPEFDNDETPSNSKTDTYFKIFKTSIIVFDIVIWLKIIWGLRGRGRGRGRGR